MARRRKDNLADDLFDLLMGAPWWGGPLLALVAFLLLRLAVPAILGIGAESPNDPLKMPRHLFSGLAVAFAPWAGMLVLFCWGMTGVKKLFNRRLLDRQTGLDSIRDLSWQEFEQLVGEAYRRQEYSVEHTGSDSGDGGIDLRLRRNGQATLVQCKHWKAFKVGVKEVRELLGVVASEKAYNGILVTYGSFTEEAVAFARKNPITLVAGPELERMIRSVQTTRHRTETGELTDRLATGSQGGESTGPMLQSAPPACPACGGPMMQRTAKQGQFAGQPFWGCSRYPACRGKRPV